MRVCKTIPHDLSMTQGVLCAISGGLIVNQTISLTINITNEEIKIKLKKLNVRNKRYGTFINWFTTI